MNRVGFGQSSFALKAIGFANKANPDGAILALFTGGKQGVWYDPSDKSTLFQDAGGAAPVTADGDPVGLVLDKSQGLSDSPDSYKYLAGTDKTSEYSLSGEARVEGDSWIINGIGTASYVRFRPKKAGDNAIESGKIYRISLKILVIEGTEFSINLNGASTQPSFKASGAAEEYTFTLAAGRNSGYIDIRCEFSTASVFEFSDLVIEGVVGNHATQSVSAARPTYKKDSTKSWLYHDKVDDKMFVPLPAMTATVVTATDDGVTINYPVTITAGDYTLTNNSALGRDFGRLIIDKELSASEQAQVTAYFNAKRGV